MSGVFKSIGKVFKKVAKVAVKIAPYALAAAAVVFTGGAALGVLPSFAGAMGGLVSSLGISGALGGALASGLTGAGFGALLGGKKGMMMGFAGGALLGGTGLLGQAASGASGPVDLLANTPYASSTAGSVAGSVGGEVAANAVTNATSQAANNGVANALVGKTSSAGGLLGLVERNPLLASSLVQGIGGGLTAKAEADEIRRERERRTANLSLVGSLLDPNMINGQASPNNNSFNPFAAQPNWIYDPEAGQMVRKS